MKGIPKGYEEVTESEVPSGYEEVSETKAELPLSQVPGKALSNLPSSLYELGKGMVTPFIHPVDTAVGVGKLMAGGLQKLVPGEQGAEESANQFGRFMAERYGGWENLKMWPTRWCIWRRRSRA